MITTRKGDTRELLVLISKTPREIGTKCWLLKIHTVPRYWIKLTGIFENTCFSSQQKNGQKHLCRTRNSIKNVDPSLKQANLPKRLSTRLAKTRVLKQYSVKNTK